MVVDGTGESPSRLTSAVEGAEQRPIYHAAFDDVEYISAVPTCGSSGGSTNFWQRGPSGGLQSQWCRVCLLGQC